MWLEELTNQLTENDKAIKDITELYEKCSDEMRRLGKVVQEKDKQIEELKEELHREVLLRVDDRKQGKVWYNELEALQKSYANSEMNLKHTTDLLVEKDKQIEELKLNKQEDDVMFHKEIKELKAQIERMKCCMNCLYFTKEGCRKEIDGCYVCSKWKLKEYGKDINVTTKKE